VIKDAGDDSGGKPLPIAREISAMFIVVFLCSI
jgi:hypothetical protein